MASTGKSLTRHGREACVKATRVRLVCLADLSRVSRQPILPALAVKRENENPLKTVYQTVECIWLSFRNLLFGCEREYASGPASGSTQLAIISRTLFGAFGLVFVNRIRCYLQESVSVRLVNSDSPLESITMIQATISLTDFHWIAQSTALSSSRIDLNVD